MPHENIETLQNITNTIASLKLKRPDLEKEFNKLNNQLTTMTPSQLTRLINRLQDYSQIHDELNIRKKECEWMTKIAPKLFDKTNHYYQELEKKLVHSHKLDNDRDQNWTALKNHFQIELVKLHDPKDQIRNKFLKHFGQKLKNEAEEFFDKYHGIMDALTEQKKQIIKSNDGCIDESVLDSEIEKKIKLIQAQLILAKSAATAEEKAANLKLAGSILFAVALSLAGSGAAIAVMGLAGSSVPVAGTIAGAAVGLVAGGIIGGIKGYHNYKEAKQYYQEQLAKTFKAPSHKFEKAASIHAGIISIKTREAFNWLMQGPQKADLDRMIYEYQLANTIHNKQQIEDLKTKLGAEFAASRGAYFSMLDNIIRASTADAALQSVAGLAIAAPFDPYTAVDLATQFTLMCHAQLGTARAMGGLEPNPEFPNKDHIAVEDSKTLAFKAASQLASNAESLVALAHQISLCTNLSEEVRNEHVANIRLLLSNTIDTYNELISKHSGLDLKQNLGDALLGGVFGDIERMGEELDVPSNQKTQEHKSYHAVIDYIKHPKFHHTEYQFYQKQNKLDKKEAKSKTGAELADIVLSVVIMTPIKAYHIPVEIAHPTPDEAPNVEITALGGAVAGLALASGVTSYFLNAKAQKKAEELSVFGNVSKRREQLYSKLGDTIELAYLRENQLHTLIDAPDLSIRLNNAISRDTLVSPAVKSVQENRQHLNEAGWSNSLFLTSGQKRQGAIQFNELNKTLESLKDDLSFQRFISLLQKEQFELFVGTFYYKTMKMLHAIKSSSQNDQLGIAQEDATLKLLKQNLAELKTITMGYNDVSQKIYLEQKNEAISMELEQLQKIHDFHLKTSIEGPRNFKAIAMDSERMNDKLASFVKLLNNEIILEDPSQRKDKINAILKEIKLIIDRQQGDLPEQTDIELVKLALQFMVGQEELTTLIADDMKSKPIITPMMIDTLIEKQQRLRLENINPARPFR